MLLDTNNKGTLFGCVVCILVWVGVGFLLGRFYYK